MSNLRVEYGAKRIGKSVAEYEASLTATGQKQEMERFKTGSKFLKKSRKQIVIIVHFSKK
jgi:hypothetical protein